MYTKGHLKSPIFSLSIRIFLSLYISVLYLGKKKMQYNMTVTFPTKTKTVTLAEWKKQNYYVNITIFFFFEQV